MFAVTFALGSGLAGLGGALGIDVLGLDPTFPLKYMVYFLLVVAVGGAGTIKGGLVAAVMLGVFDVAGKYYVPQIGAFIIYFLMVALLIVFPAGLYGRRGSNGNHAEDAGDRAEAPPDAGVRPRSSSGSSPLAAFLVFPIIVCSEPGPHLRAFRAVARSHPRLRGASSRSATRRSSASAPTPRVCSPRRLGRAALRLVAGAAAAPWASRPASWWCAARISRGSWSRSASGCALEAANQAAFITGGVDGLSGVTMGKLFGLFRSASTATRRFSTASRCSSSCSWSRAAHPSPFGLSLRGIREKCERMPAIGAPVRGG